MNPDYGMMDLDFHKELYEEENSFRNSLFSLPNENMLLKQDSAMETWNQSDDFDADDLLQYLGSDVTSEVFPAGVEVKRNDAPLQKCEVDDVLGSFPGVSFDAIMSDTLDGGRFESPASDSGFSSDNNCEFQLSPNVEGSTGVLSPDTLDAVSDVSSSSDLGSLGSVGSPPTATSEQETSMLYEYPSPPSEENSSEKLYFIPASNENIISANHQINPPKIKVELPTNKSNIKSISLKSFKQAKGPETVMLPGQSSDSGIINNGQTIVVTEASTNGSHFLRKGISLLKTTANGKSILFPVNFKDSNQLRTIKVINSGNNLVKKNLRTLTVRQMPSVSVHHNRAVIHAPKPINDRPVLKVNPTSYLGSDKPAPRFVAPSITIKEEPYDEETPQNGQELILNDEEKKLLKKEQIILPAQYPLTKQEERDLKRIRRKIRNKISAQDSRKRKKEYVDGLEDRVKRCNDENQKLSKRIRHLESQNESLSSQLKRLQQFVGGRNHPHTSTAVMMLALSFALIVIPTLRPQDAREAELAASSHVPSPGQTRNLLEAGISTVNGHSEGNNLEEGNVSEKPQFHPLTDHDYAPLAKKPRLDEFSPIAGNFPLPMKALPTEGEPPDPNMSAISTFFGSLLNSFGKNWTESSRQEMRGPWNDKVPHEGTKSLVVNLNSRGRFMDDIELE